ncbi:group II intron reverse transcriptase/maturase [Brasilonema bromeliae]|uniref:Group II intron reverse transcriptase/maturase n=1 Tax=Brasilonema bromeliae SPC951 TaxID=385972 RepID=A0ABX1PGF7_9CYAN|nr:group II intron reverse transcriptase/maturase [Brasilonema bromeliae]NMG23033.1 group II intron reverse transcriptase/maturase [Brasilonema bromeliae SPC951]
MSKTLSNQMVEWNKVNWRKLERIVFKLQKRIYQASLRGDSKAVRKLQKTLMTSWSAKMLAVRKVTQDNKGKSTAGVDGVKSLNPKQRIELVTTMNLNQKVKPTRRVWIPKPGKAEKRPLGIPTMHDRATQALVKLALEPEWEAKFEENSYGFRPGRSTQDAMQMIFNCINQVHKYVLDADISKCFDKINHEKLLNKINTFPKLRRTLKAWLKSGVLDNGYYSETFAGTPQGGVISPLLANIALHGLEGIVDEFIRGIKYRKLNSMQCVRYADDFVILTNNKANLEIVQQKVSDWLAEMGLELNTSKTRITHTDDGFDFLGFNFKHYNVGKYKSGKNGNGKLLGFKTFIKPSRESIQEHYKHLANQVDRHKASPQAVLINVLNPIIKGWVNYYSTAVSAEVFKDLDDLLFKKLSRWAKRRHPKKSWNWVQNKYWHTVGGNNWVFSDKVDEKTVSLYDHQNKKIVRHVKVKGTATPFDGNLKYWSIRKGSNPLVPTRVATLLKAQKGKCKHCGLYFREDDITEVDHIIPRSKKGKDTYTNLQLLHRHCHDTKTANDLLTDWDFIEWQ